MLQLQLTQNPQRYSNTESEVTISAQSEALGNAVIKPLVLKEVESDIVLEEGLDLSIKGLVIWIEDLNRYITSSEMVSVLEEAIQSNPHYTYKELTSVMGVKMGKTIPFIKVSLTGVNSEVEKQKSKVKFAGVKSVVWSYENPSEDISLLLQQINWTLSNSIPKPLDTFLTYDLNLSGDYSITSLPIIPLDKNAKIPEETLTKNLDIINSRLVELRRDFNSIKDVFYFGKQPSNVTTSHTILATADEADDISIQVVTKETTKIANQSLPSNLLADISAEAVKSVDSKVEEAQTTLTQRISNNEATIQSAQTGDAQAQAALSAQLKESRNFIQRLRDRLKANNQSLDI